MYRIVLAAALLAPSLASAATLYVQPEKGTYGLGDTFIAEIRMDNEGTCINAASVDVSYSTDALRAVDFSKGGSILSLWIEEPAIDTEKGTVRFAGGIPGGYCGRVQGDPVLSNVLGKIVFTVVGASAQRALVRIEPSSQAYIHDGRGTPAPLTGEGASFTVVPEPQNAENPWIAAVRSDTTPPDPFVVTVESTRGVFRGRYYAVFSTVDKQSGLDHYEIMERGSWKTVTSPHELRDQYLRGPIMIKAVDKAGNERLGEYVEGSQAPRVFEPGNYILAILVIAALLALGLYMRYRDRARA